MTHQQSETAAQAPSTAEPPAAIQRLLDQTVADGGYPGILAAARGSWGRGWFAHSGVADVTTRAPRRREERFRIGSLTKAFAAVVVLQLVGEGRLSLDATAAELVAGVLEEGLGMDGHAVTIREMLNHTSGIPDVLPGQQPVPGERGRFLYSKVNYTLLGMIVEAVTGSSLAMRSSPGSVARWI